MLGPRAWFEWSKQTTIECPPAQPIHLCFFEPLSWTYLCSIFERLRVVSDIPVVFHFSGLYHGALLFWSHGQFQGMKSEIWHFPSVLQVSRLPVIISSRMCAKVSHRQNRKPCHCVSTKMCQTKHQFLRLPATFFWTSMYSKKLFKKNHLFPWKWCHVHRHISGLAFGKGHQHTQIVVARLPTRLTLQEIKNKISSTYHLFLSEKVNCGESTAQNPTHKYMRKRWLCETISKDTLWYPASCFTLYYTKTDVIEPVTGVTGFLNNPRLIDFSMVPNLSRTNTQDQKRLPWFSS